MVISAQKALKKGDMMGWGVLDPPEGTDSVDLNGDKLLICYLTINRNVALTRVMYQPPGGFYPVVIMPEGGKHLTMKFTCSTLHNFHFS